MEMLIVKNIIVVIEIITIFANRIKLFSDVLFLHQFYFATEQISKYISKYLPFSNYFYVFLIFKNKIIN